MKSLWIFILLFVFAILLIYILRQEKQNQKFSNRSILINMNKPDQILNHQIRMIKSSSFNKEKDIWKLDLSGMIINSDNKCMIAGNLPGDRVILSDCKVMDDKKLWKYENQNLISLSNQLCMESIANSDEIRMWHCDSDFNSQKWSFQ